jgi:flagellar hook-associated protein 3 FlgL
MSTIGKSMFPLRTSFQHIANMKARYDKLQGQLATGLRAANLAELGSDRFFDLTLRTRLTRIDTYRETMSTVNLRLDLLDKTLTRLDTIEADQRALATPGGYGSSNVNFATTPEISRSRLDEVLSLLNIDLAGRYLMGGKVTDQAPVKMAGAVLNGENGRDGFGTIATERRLADLGAQGRGRLEATWAGAGTGTVTLAEDGAHPFGFKLLAVDSTAAAITLDRTQLPQEPASLGITFTALPNAGDAVTLGFRLPDGTETSITLRATTNSPPSAGQFEIGADEDATAQNLVAALNLELERVARTELAAASIYAAADNFFSGPGEPVLRVSGNPQTATELRVASPSDTVHWYSGETSAIGSVGMGRLSSATLGDTVTVREARPVATGYGFRLTGITGSANVAVSNAATSPNALTAQVTAVPAAGETVTLTLSAPDGSTRQVSLTAVSGVAGAGQFSIGGSAAETADNLGVALETALQAAADIAAGTPRHSVSARIDDNSSVQYGVRANESGLLELVRTLGAMSVETYEGDTANQRFDAMVERQLIRLSEGRNSEPGAIEVLAVELGLAKAKIGSVGERLTAYDAQLMTMLAEIESISKEEVAVEILALQTRLEASYATTAAVAQLSLVNYLPR